MDTIKRLNENLSKLDEARKSALGFLSELTDDKSFVETGAFTSGTTFEDGVEALGEGIITGYATVFGIPVYLFVQNFEAMRGSFSSAQATKIKNVMDAAVKNGVPFVSVIDSAGARLDEGAKVLEGYAKIIRLAASMKNEVPHVAVIRGADGPTAIYVTSRLAPNLMGPIAIAAYSYMALVPVIQPPIMKLLTTEKERKIRMEQLRPVSKKEKIMFPIIVTGIVGIVLPSALPLLGMLMLGNLFKESGVVPRLVKTASNELINIVTILLGVVVGTKAFAPYFLTLKTLKILFLGVFAFSMGTASGVLFGKLMCKLSKGKINPLIGAAGVSAVPMAARVVQDVGRQYDPENYLLMHAMGPNVAGVIGSAIAAGVLLAIL